MEKAFLQILTKENLKIRSNFLGNGKVEDLKIALAIWEQVNLRLLDNFKTLNPMAFVL